MPVFHIDPAELKIIIDQTLDRLHAIVYESTAMGWRITRIHSPGKVSLTMPIKNLPRYAGYGEQVPELHLRINRHIERLTTETQTRVLSYEVDIERGNLGLYVQVNANLVSAAIDTAQEYDEKRRANAASDQEE